MSESHRNKCVPPWLEGELSRHLGPVTAPESLWERIHQCPVPRQRSPLQWALWPVAAAMLLLTSGGVAWQSGKVRNHVGDMEQLAEQELQRLVAGSNDFDFQSSDPGEIRAWVKAKVKIDIDLAAGRSDGEVRLLGVRLIQHRGAPVAAIDYRVGEDAATLLVLRKASSAGTTLPASEHLFSRIQSAGSSRLVSWSMREQAYTMALSGTRDPQGGCFVCHVDAHGPTTFN